MLLGSIQRKKYCIFFRRDRTTIYHSMSLTSHKGPRFQCTSVISCTISLHKTQSTVRCCCRSLSCWQASSSLHGSGSIAVVQKWWYWGPLGIWTSRPRGAVRVSICCWERGEEDKIGKTAGSSQPLGLGVGGTLCARRSRPPVPVTGHHGVGDAGHRGARDWSSRCLWMSHGPLAGLVVIA